VLLAVLNISHKGTGLYFEYANDDIHLPKNPLGLIVNGLCFSPDNVFSIRCIPNSIKVALGIGYLRIGNLLFGGHSSKTLHCVLYAQMPNTQLPKQPLLN